MYTSQQMNVVVFCENCALEFIADGDTLVHYHLSDTEKQFEGLWLFCSWECRELWQCPDDCPTPSAEDVV